MTKWLQKQWEMIIDEVGTTRNKWGQRITDVNYILCTFLLRSGTSKSTWFKHCRVCTFQVLIPQTFRGPYFFRSWTARDTQFFQSDLCINSLFKHLGTAQMCACNCCPHTIVHRIHCQAFWNPFLLKRDLKKVKSFNHQPALITRNYYVGAPSLTTRSDRTLRTGLLVVLL